MSDLIDTTEMYLRTIYELEEEGVVALRARIAERLGQTGPTVSQTVARMERDGLLRVSGDRHLELTELGRTKAIRVMRKHRLAERLLLDVIGLDWQYVHEEACRWEHVMSERVEVRLLHLLGDPRESPYGNPIPGLAELGGPVAAVDGPPLRSLAAVLAPGPDADGHRGRSGSGSDAGSDSGSGSGSAAGWVVRRLGEPLQTRTDVMADLDRIGVRPGSRIHAALRSDGAAPVLVVSGAGGRTELPVEVAAQVFVAERGII